MTLGFFLIFFNFPWQLSGFPELLEAKILKVPVGRREARMSLMLAQTRLSTLEDMASRTADLSEQLARLQQERSVEKLAWQRERAELLARAP